MQIWVNQFGKENSFEIQDCVNFWYLLISWFQDDADVSTASTQRNVRGHEVTNVDGCIVLEEDPDQTFHGQLRYFIPIWFESYIVDTQAS